MQTMSSVTSGMIITGASWEKVNYAALPLIVVVLAGLAWFALAQRAVRTARPNEA